MRFLDSTTASIHLHISAYAQVVLRCAPVDEEKQRYFKIESGSTAPSTAAWSIDSVKKRKAEKELAKQEKKRQERTKDLIKRSPALAHPQTGGRLVREFGIIDPELPVESWAAGLRERGEVCLLQHRRSDDTPNMSCMIINGDDEASGLGVVYASKSISSPVLFALPLIVCTLTQALL